ncbi:hypothetical protein TruAng_006988 [Truncatella angustata]|nr:hypothetical protein TruAng_006988 [Truncatella angustata]
MCTGTSIIWQCSNQDCRGTVLVERNWMNSQFCSWARSRRMPCPSYKTTWSSTVWSDAGKGVNHRESLTDPKRGTAFLRFNDFYCLYCEMGGFEFQRLVLHGESEALDQGAWGAVDDGARAQWLWRKAEMQQQEHGLNTSRQRSWYSMIPCDGGDDTTSVPVEQDIAIPESELMGSLSLCSQDSGEKLAAAESPDEDYDDEEEEIVYKGRKCYAMSQVCFP